MSHYYWGAANSSGVQPKHVRVRLPSEISFFSAASALVPHISPVSSSALGMALWRRYAQGVNASMSGCMSTSNEEEICTHSRIYVRSFFCRVEASWMTEPGSRILTGCALAGKFDGCYSKHTEEQSYWRVRVCGCACVRVGSAVSVHVSVCLSSLVFWCNRHFWSRDLKWR